MTDATARFPIPGSYLVARGFLPTPAELALGWRSGWISVASAVELALARYEAGISQDAAEEDLALLLSDRYDLAPDLLGSLAADDPAAPRFWLFAALAWLRDGRASDDPLDDIALLYDDFDFPSELEGLVRYLPASPGVPVGVPAMEERWRAYVDRVGAGYVARARGWAKRAGGGEEHRADRRRPE
jgi:hypothetical protein